MIIGAEKKVLIFLEHPEDVVTYLAMKPEIIDIHICIATQPAISWELEKKGIMYSGIESFYDPQMVYSKGMENYTNVETVCSSIDIFFHEQDPFMEKI